MAQAKNGDTVEIRYTGKLEDGTVFDSSQGRDPLQFILGGKQVIPGFEEAVTGMETGDKKTATIPPEQAYGPYRDEMLITMEKERFPKDMDLKTGTMVRLKGQNEQEINVPITKVEGEKVTLDANHPLAGKALVFDIELVGIK